MNLTWDPDKAADNWVKHRVSFPDVEAVFYDPDAITREDVHSEGEQRLVTLGLDNSGRAHAGENLAALLAKRQADQAPPLVMSDALSRKWDC